MSAKNAHDFEGIEPRTVRAVTECMAVDAYAHGDETGMFDAYSASGNTYTVSLRDPLGCTCPDFTRRGDRLGDAGCKHVRRVRLMLGIDSLPKELADDVDPTLAANRDKFGASEPEPDAGDVEATADRAIADGGQLLKEIAEDTADGCPHDHPECEGVGARERPILCFDCWDNWASN